MLHRMKLIGSALCSQFMEWHNSGITTFKHAWCAPYARKPNNYQFYLPKPLKLCDNILKKIWKFWNGPLCRNKSVPPLCSILQHIGRVVTPTLVPRNCLRYFQKTLIMGGGGLVPEVTWGIVGEWPIGILRN